MTPSAFRPRSQRAPAPAAVAVRARRIQRRRNLCRTPKP